MPYLCYLQIHEPLQHKTVRLLKLCFAAITGSSYTMFGIFQIHSFDRVEGNDCGLE